MKPKPTRPCSNCGFFDWWWRETFGPGDWLCGHCHPNPNEEEVMKEEVELVNGKFVVKGSKKEEVKTDEKKVVPKQYSEEVLVLRDRVIAGNKKLNDAWEIIKGMDHDSQQWKDEFERWHQANERLSVLCSQLKGMGYTNCLYINESGERTKKCLEQGSIGCRVCPSQFPYWEKEFSEL